ncbi:hypothetical protein MASR2M78_27550 [Treponema sp.]
MLRAWYDMVTIREFENMLNTFKTMGTWGGIEYNHKDQLTFPLARKRRQ